jgi:hypothetical protein
MQEVFLSGNKNCATLKTKIGHSAEYAVNVAV